jgi:RimJ/RimL family protein N-acetyltransferase
MTPATYSARERLRDGRTIEIRALRPSDEAGMLEAINNTNAESLRRRFFVTKREFSDKEKAFFMNADFVKHVALVAEIEADGKREIVGGGRYVEVQAGEAEVAFIVIDAYRGQGIGTLLMRHLAVIARSAGLRELTADVLPENAPMRKVFSKFGFEPRRGMDPQVIHLALALQ